ncbi:hypothetical protein A4X06_0g7566 [Tilletia controversa]|uniref:Uncharacterized protein n=2 Tax=Tilletia TaxID=13289 RepID=A0A8X7MLR8_9BASI|nr:hypothetical protein A4X06_0g7566 [Tilletia controversa]
MVRAHQIQEAEETVAVCLLEELETDPEEEDVPSLLFISQAMLCDLYTPRYLHQRAPIPKSRDWVDTIFPDLDAARFKTRLWLSSSPLRCTSLAPTGREAESEWRRDIGGNLKVTLSTVLAAWHMRFAIYYNIGSSGQESRSVQKNHGTQHNEPDWRA